MLQADFNQLHLFGQRFIAHADVEPIVLAWQAGQIFRRNGRAFGQLHRAAVGGLADNHALDTAEGIVVENAQLIAQILAVAFQLGIDNGLGAFIALDAFTGKHLHINHRAAHAGGHAQRGVFHIGCFFAENRTQKLFFRRELGFAFRGNFAHQHIAGFHFRTDIHNTRFIQAVLHALREVGNIAGDVFRTQLGVARHHI